MKSKLWGYTAINNELIIWRVILLIYEIASIQTIKVLLGWSRGTSDIRMRALGIEHKLLINETEILQTVEVRVPPSTAIGGVSIWRKYSTYSVQTHDWLCLTRNHALKDMSCVELCSPDSWHAHFRSHSTCSCNPPLQPALKRLPARSASRLRSCNPRQSRYERYFSISGSNL